MVKQWAINLLGGVFFFFLSYLVGTMDLSGYGSYRTLCSSLFLLFFGMGLYAVVSAFWYHSEKPDLEFSL